MNRGRVLRSRTIRRVALLLALVGALLWLWLGMPAETEGDPGLVGSQDFIEYWSAAQLLLRGENPYDPAALLAVQKEIGWSGSEPVRMWNPPWTLTLVLPLALVPFQWAVSVWMLLGVGLILGSGLILWRQFAPGDGRYWIGLLLAAGFVPGLIALSLGQITPWMLAGAAGFLWLVDGRRDVLAGAALSLLLVKPHAAYLFLLAVVWWALRSRRWGVLAGSLAVLTASGALVSVVSPTVFRDFLTAYAEAPLKWATPTLGFWLRLAAGLDRRFLQYVPSIVGTMGIVVWLASSREAWDWGKVSPPLLLASGVTAAYGWSFDHVLLLPAVVALVARQSTSHRRHRGLVLAALLSTQVALLVQQLLQVGDFLSVWHAPALSVLYSWDARSETKRTEHDAREGQDA